LKFDHKGLDFVNADAGGRQPDRIAI
jgi:hypothetical protein